MKVLILSTMLPIELRGVNIDTVDKTKYFPFEYKKTDESGEIVIKNIPDCLPKYRIIKNDECVEMNTQEKADKDQELADIQSQLELAKKDLIKSMDPLVKNAFLKLLEYINNGVTGKTPQEFRDDVLEM